MYNLYVYIYIHISTYVYYICMYTHIYIYMCTYIHDWIVFRILRHLLYFVTWLLPFKNILGIFIFFQYASLCVCVCSLSPSLLGPLFMLINICGYLHPIWGFPCKSKLGSVSESVFPGTFGFVYLLNFSVKRFSSPHQSTGAWSAWVELQQFLLFERLISLSLKIKISESIVRICGCCVIKMCAVAVSCPYLDTKRSWRYLWASLLSVE